MTTPPICGHAAAEHTKTNQIWHEESRGECSHLFQILLKSVKVFQGCEGPKVGVSHWLWLSHLEQVSTSVLPVRCTLFPCDMCININVAEGESEANQWPSFVDSSNMVQHYLTDTGVKATCRVLNVIAHERPDITYSPLLFTVTAILLHYLDEAACYTCVSSLVTSKHRYIAQTMISHQAQTFTVGELASKHVVCTVSYSEHVDKIFQWRIS